MIRNAVIADLPAIRKLGRTLLDQTPYAEQEIDIAALGQTFGNCVNSALGFCVVAEHDGEVTGFMMGCALPLFYAKGRMASDLSIYGGAHNDGAYMVKRFIRWARQVPNCVEITLSQSSGIEIERTGRFYEALGFQHVGNIYTMAVPAKAMEEAA